MSVHPADVELAYETLAAAAADPLIEGFDFADLQSIGQACETAPTRWLVAASYFFEYLAKRRRGGPAADEEFQRSIDGLKRVEVQ